MTKVEFSALAMALRTYYPKENLLPNLQAMELWFRELQDIPFDVAETGLRKWVATNKWSPAISDLRDICNTIKSNEIPDWGKAWESVLHAIRNFGMYNEQEALNSLEETAKKAVERLGFRNLCTSDNIAVERANFRMVYEQIIEAEKKKNQVPPQVQKLIDAYQNRLMLKGDDGK